MLEINPREQLSPMEHDHVFAEWLSDQLAGRLEVDYWRLKGLRERRSMAATELENGQLDDEERAYWVREEELARTRIKAITEATR